MSESGLRSRVPRSLIVWLILLLLSIALFAASYNVGDPRKRHISLSRGFHVSLTERGDFDARIVFFSDAEYGPYQGSLVSVSAVDGSEPEYPKSLGFGDLLGIYFRHFRWPDQVLWTLAVSLWYPILCSAFGATVVTWRWRRRVSRAQGAD